MKCECVAIPPYWYEKRCKKCLDEERAQWAEAMRTFPAIIERIRKAHDNG